MRLRYDPSVDMGYLYLRPAQEQRAVARSIPWSNQETRSELVLDFDAEDRLVGIELFSVSRLLRPDQLRGAEDYPSRDSTPSAPDSKGAEGGGDEP